MNTEKEFIDHEFIERLKARDQRFKDIDNLIQIDKELKESFIIKTILEVMQDDANKAVDELLVADPLDSKRISVLQAKINHAKLIGNTIESLRNRGIAANRSVIEDGELHIEADDEGDK